MKVHPLSHGWAELAMLSLVSFALYQFNMFFAFLIPLRMVYLKRGGRDFLYSAAAVLGAIVVFGLLRIRPSDSSLPYMQTIGTFWIVLAPLFLGGLYVVESDVPRVHRRLHKILIATVLAGLVGIPTMAAIGGIEEVFRANLLLAQDLLPGMNEFLAASVGYDAEGIDIDLLVAVVKESFLGSYLFIYFGVMALAVGVSDWIYSRTRQEKRWTLMRYHVESWMVWLLLAAWTLVLINQLVELGFVIYVALNFGMIMLVVYGLQGYAIIKTLLEKRNASQALRRLVSFLIVVFLFWPGLRFIVIIGLPVLGVSELWIHYRLAKEE